MERKPITFISSSRFPKNSSRPAWTADAETKNKKKQFLLSTWRLLVLHFAYCCKTTSLHCFHYLSDPKCSKKVRLMWVCVLTVAVYATVRMISDQFRHFYNNPTVYSHLASRKFIQDIPFPAVTICSHNQIPPSAFDYSATLLKPSDQLTEKEKFQLDFANYFCDFGSLYENFHEYLNVSVIEEIYQQKSNFCEEEFAEIEWQRNTLINSCDFLQQVLTWYGHCYTFNMVPFEDFYQPNYTYWYSSFFPSNRPESSTAGETKAYYNDGSISNKNVIYWDSSLPKTPWSTNGSAITGGGKFALNFRSHDFDSTCSLGDKSFIAIVHPPDEIASWSHENHIIRDNSIVLIKLFPEIVEHSKGLEALPPSRRKCYIDGERFLRFFQVYNQHNCEVECHANRSIRHCGCVAYFHPRDEATPVCNQARSYCVIKVQQNLSEGCNCLPKCSRISYNTELLYINKHKRIDPLLDLSLLFVQFPKKGVTTKVAENIGGKFETASNLGGLLCLFLGAGLISLLEIVYMFSLRPLVTVWNYRRTAKKQNLSIKELWSYGARKAAWWH